MAVTVGTFREFKKILPEGKEFDFLSRQNALEIYLTHGGVTKFELGDWFPRLLYPTVSRLESQIGKVDKKIMDLDTQVLDWNKRHRHLLTNKATDVVARVADLLYWEHRTKLVSDPSYRETFELVRPPMHLLHRDKWRKRLKMFIRSKEYRIRLHEARISIIGKKRAPMAEEVEARMDFNRQLADAELKKLSTKRKLLASRRDAMRVMLTWSKSKH